MAPAFARGRAVGSLAWDVQPGSRMPSGTVHAAVACGPIWAREVTLSFDARRGALPLTTQVIFGKRGTPGMAFPLALRTGLVSGRKVVAPVALARDPCASLSVLGNNARIAHSCPDWKWVQITAIGCLWLQMSAIMTE